jgi:hypothetical protein
VFCTYLHHCTWLTHSQVVYAAATGIAIYGVLVGLGRINIDLNEWQQGVAMKYYIIWILTYVLALATVKSSICVTIMRIASTKLNLRITVYVLLAITWASFFITFIGTLTYCQPVEAIWTPALVLSGKATCAPVDTFVIIGHVATVSTILTDLALVVVPAIILWNTQMKRQAKLQAFGLLSFASVASIITMVRIPYVNKFEAMVDLPCKFLPPPHYRVAPNTLNSLGRAYPPLLQHRNRHRLHRLVAPLAPLLHPKGRQQHQLKGPEPTPRRRHKNNRRREPRASHRPPRR